MAQLVNVASSVWLDKQILNALNTSQKPCRGTCTVWTSNLQQLVVQDPREIMWQLQDLTNGCHCYLSLNAKSSPLIYLASTLTAQGRISLFAISCPDLKLLVPLGWQALSICVSFICFKHCHVNQAFLKQKMIFRKKVQSTCPTEEAAKSVRCENIES